MSTHSPEPWKVEEYRLDYCNEVEIHIVDAKGSPVFCATQSMYETNIVEAFPEDWRRVVACVNFCREFPTEALEGRQLVYLKQAQWESLADMPKFDGLMAVRKIDE